ncbi:class I SAM-dependent methyltransferase [Amycolatopsis sp. A133]|uniref:class I SAM-dependent methyltransferase n=1 Tax=Amycolatopsis sp. A133 TaxID=3064472 RepID=UPI0027F25536|nr:class I SAM-dependent methyltransferase [Amycolatopsis sp. A133]MDQ7803703.1 class I SAM-dependent methyltransferase [Amycolatopsis sp. A133]
MTRPETAAEVFDALGTDYEHAFRTATAQRAALTDLLAALPPEAKVLDLGAGTGRPTAELLVAAGHDVTGYDVAPKMVEIARSQVPAARFELGDMRELSFADGTWDAITAFFSMLQLPRPEQETMIGRLAAWLKPGGLLVFATVPADVDGSTSSSWGTRSARAASPPPRSPGCCAARGSKSSARTRRSSSPTTRAPGPSRTCT